MTDMTESIAINSSRCKGSDTVSHGIRVTVSPEFEAGHSSPDSNRFVFSYRIRIENRSDRRVQLLRREWRIIDADGQRETVAGDGVVGERPTLEPGESFEYASWCPLETSWGTMEGEYTFSAEPGGEIRVGIGRFFLVAEPVLSPS